MTNLQVRKLTNRLNKIDTLHSKMGKRIDDLKNDLLVLQMESQEMRSDLEDLINNSGSSGKKGARISVSAARRKA